MAKELPYFQFEPAEYLSGDILLCSYEAQGVFVHLMSIYWQRNCELTLVKAQRLLKSEGLNELVEEGILILEGENQDIIISFLDKQFEQLTKRKKRLSDAGKKGAEIKAAKATLKPPLSDDEPTPKQPEETREDEKREEKKKVDNKEERANKFATSVLEFKKYDLKMLEAFISYWTESNEGSNVLRFEMKKNQPFNIDRRLVTWKSRQKDEPIKQGAQHHNAVKDGEYGEL